MIKCDYHVHTCLSDGAEKPEKVVLAALEKGMDRIGFSDHGYTSFDSGWCMSKRNTRRYLRILNRLKKKYAGRIEILIGIEQDYYSEQDTAPFDYVIGSVHYILAEGNYITVDESADTLKNAAEKWFGGDMIALAERYFETVAAVAEKTHADIIGHFDLVSKFNEDDRLFDSSDPRYRAAWQAAADRLLQAGIPFEINTGAISRGYRTGPYPSPEMIDYIRAHGGKLLLSSDSHRPSTLCYAFDVYEQLADQGLEKTIPAKGKAM